MIERITSFDNSGTSHEFVVEQKDFRVKEYAGIDFEIKQAQKSLKYFTFKILFLDERRIMIYWITNNDHHELSGKGIVKAMVKRISKEYQRDLVTSSNNHKIIIAQKRGDQEEGRVPNVTEFWDKWYDEIYNVEYLTNEDRYIYKYSPLLIGFPNHSQLVELIKKTGDDACGTVSICSIYTFFGLNYNPDDLKALAMDGKAAEGNSEGGSSILGIALAASINPLIQVHIYSMAGESIEKIDELHGMDFEEVDKHLVTEIKKKKNIFFHQSISLEEVMSKISTHSIPILQFYRNGNKDLGHSSPLIGLKNNWLLLPVPDSAGRIKVNKDKFNDSWWLEKSCIFLIK